MGEKPSLGYVLLTKDAIIRGTSDEQFVNWLAFAHIEQFWRLELRSVTLTPIGGLTYPTCSFPRLCLWQQSMLIDTPVVLPGDEAALARMQKVYGEQRDAVPVMVYAGTYAVSGRALTSDFFKTKDIAFFPVVDATVSSLVPETRFADLSVPWALVNNHLARVGML